MKNEKVETELVDTRTALLSYKNMNEVVSEQVKVMKLTSERKKDENQNLYQAIREL
jgi:uncharacterized protein YktA (UPF0223 family)